ncbi:MAG: hypothetical protein J6V69_04990 [Clostridia bacterium]|nr:hypothetical protein [Clostridia bacterium]
MALTISLPFVKTTAYLSYFTIRAQYFQGPSSLTRRIGKKIKAIALIKTTSAIALKIDCQVFI